MEYVLDCKHIEDPRQFHKKLQTLLALPSYYGHNLDAMADCLTELGVPTKLTLDNFSCLQESLGDYAGKLMYVLHVCTEENPNLEISLES